MKLYKGKYQYYYHNNAESAHYITSILNQISKILESISTIIIAIIAKIIPATP